MTNNDTSTPPTAKRKNVQRKTRGPEKPKPPKQTYSDEVIADLLKSDSIVIETATGNLWRYERVASVWDSHTLTMRGWFAEGPVTAAAIRRELRECNKAWVSPATNMNHVTASREREGG